MFRYRHFICLLMAVAFAFDSSAQTSRPVKVAVFAPLYLDSVFNKGEYKLSKNSNLPRYILSGLDFYNGVMLAVDSLNAEKINAEVLIYDTKSDSLSLDEIINEPGFAEISMIVASFNNRTEIQTLAAFAEQKNIPLISATYPNDGGITANPFFVLINPTLATHIEGIFKYIRRYYPAETIIMFRRKGNVEDMIQNSFADLNKKTPGTQIKMKTVELPDSFTTSQVLDNLDSNKQNIILCGTLNEAFGLNLSKALSSGKPYRVTAIGMPTWDGIRDISKGLEVVYSSPYYFNRLDKNSLRLQANYTAKYAGRPTDMAFKGFESLYHFTKLLIKNGKAFINHLSDKEFKLFNDFDIQPIRLNKTSGTIDYLENKKLYFLKKFDGTVRTVN